MKFTSPQANIPGRFEFPAISEATPDTRVKINNLVYISLLVGSGQIVLAGDVRKVCEHTCCLVVTLGGSAN